MQFHFFFFNYFYFKIDCLILESLKKYLPFKQRRQFEFYLHSENIFMFETKHHTLKFLKMINEHFFN